MPRKKRDNNKIIKKVLKTKKIEGKCYHYSKYGHSKSQCWGLQREKGNNSANIIDDLLLMTVDSGLKKDDEKDDNSLFENEMFEESEEEKNYA